MAKIKFYLDNRRRDKYGSVLMMKISHRNTTALISLGLKVDPKNWSDDEQKLIGSPKKTAYNALICAKKREVENIVFELMQSGRLDKVCAKDIKTAVLPQKTAIKKPCGSFVKMYESFLSHKQGRTKEIYETTLSRLRQYEEKLDDINLEDVTKEWLLGFDDFLKETSKSVNGRNIHFRNIRAVFNSAIDEEKTTYYPFRKFKIKNEETVKRSLSVEQLRTIFTAPLQPYQEKYMDCFKLMFYLVGINVADLCNLKDIENGRIVYRRAKTHKMYSIKVEPEAMEIIEKYRGTSRLLNFIDGVDVHGFTRRCNEALQKIGDTSRLPGRGGKIKVKPLFPHITTYTARHSWATIAANDLDAPYDIISKALGHSDTSGAKVTSVYVDYDMKKVDRLNRAVIDWVLYEKK